MLSIKDLHVSVEDKAILRGLSLDVHPRRSSRHYGAKRFGQKYLIWQRLPGEKIMK